jgi:diguanylate cyclase (GGDEF)-like protein/PAS domain S-box-containing protein
MRGRKFFIAIALLIFVIIGSVLYMQYRNVNATRMQLLLGEGRSLSNFTDAFRETYQQAFAANHLKITDKNIVFLPVMTIDSIAHYLTQKVNGEVRIRTVSSRPRNERNRANTFEQEQLRYFQAHPDENYRIVRKGSSYFYLRPLRIVPSCLKCHSDRAKAPKVIREQYANAYGYTLGDLRGLSSVEITHRESFDTLMMRYKQFALTVLAAYVLLMVMLYWLLRKMYAMEYHHAEELERKVEETTRALHKQKGVFETLFEKSSDGIVILEDEIIVQCNEKAVKMLQYGDKDTLRGTSLIDLSPENQLDGSSSQALNRALMHEAWQQGYCQFEWVYLRKDAEAFVADVNCTRIEIEGRDVLYVVWRDISEKKIAEEKMLEQKRQLHYQANHDALTGLPNRTLLMDRLEQRIQHAQRNDGRIAVFFIDLDRFKTINDSLGHDIGDRILIDVAQRLKAVIRIGDTLTRLGGDEFTIICECPSGQMRFSAHVAEDILRQLVEPFLIDGHTLYISASIGVSFYPQDATGVNDLLKFADAAMYKAKNEGRNTYRYYVPEMTQVLLERVRLEEDLRLAIMRDEFVLYYQPQFALREGRISGLEALVRWEHPQRGQIKPDAFVPLAKETGMIVEIDRWVMRTAMRQVLRWRDDGRDPGLLSLNLSVRQLMSNAFVETVRTLIQEEHFDPKWLELEITEREMMRDQEKSIVFLRQLQQMGISIAIDDFGTGYSLLSHLKNLPINRIKIDRVFVQGIPDDAEDSGIVEAIMMLAKSLELDVIAEGVELQAQADFLLALQCDYAQGYFYSRPVTAKVFEGLLHT